MKLERVDITGFKSFGEKAELTFHRGVTAVVGPNGCGKSNISDAIGWVLGEQSAKSLRGQKMQDLIFNGSESRPPLALAEVNLKVSNVILPGRGEDGNGEPTRGECVVTRRLSRSGDSEYLLDGVPSRLRDVQDLFMGTGVGSKAYAIIEQGKIGLILSSKPTDRRIIIEEAAGITKYKARRRSAELKLTAAQQNLMRVNDIVYEITRQMNSLKRQAGKARRYRRLRESMSGLERVFAVKRAEQQDAVLADVRRRLESASDEELRRSTSLTTAEGYLERNRLEQADLEVRLTDARERLHQLELTIERLDKSIERDEAQCVELAARRSQLESESEELERRRGPVSERLALRKEEESGLAQELEGREQETTRQQDLLKQAGISLAELESRIEERRSEIVHRISKIAALHNFLQGVLANGDKVSSDLVKLTEELREVASEEERIAASLGECTTELDGRRADRSRLEEERATLERDAESTAKDLDDVDQRMSQDKDELAALTARLASLQDLVAARAHFADGAKRLLDLGQEHGIQVHGSVADAVEVDERYERAAEALYDTALQWIRVEGEDDVRLARELLGTEGNPARSELLVRSLPVAARRGAAEALAALRRRGSNEAHGLLSEFVRFPEGSLSSLPNAIVVDDLEQALRCYREVPADYVTLAGEVLNAAGVVSVGPGGASEGILKTKREIRELEEGVRERSQKVAETAEARARLASRLASLSDRAEGVRDRVHGLDKTIVGLEHRRDQLDEERQRLARKREMLGGERQRAESEKAALAQKRVEMESTLGTEEASKVAAESDLEDLRGELSGRRDVVEELQTRAAEEASRLAALRERRDAVRTDVERLEEGVRELLKRIEGHRVEREGVDERTRALEEAVATARQELESSVTAQAESEALTRELESTVAKRRERIDSTESALKLRRRELEDVRQRRSEVEIALAKEEADLRHLSEGFESGHGMTIAEAAELLNPAELQRNDDTIGEELEDLKSKIDAIGPVNPMADEEFQELETRHEFVTKQRQDLLDSIKSTEAAIQKIDRTSRQRFKEAFDAINEEFTVTFRQLFGGGRAGLRLVDEQDVLESGIDIIAQPPGKTLQNVLLLSGGEKAMTAIALLFAIFRYRPSPFCLLDEVDAPLDDANVGRFLSMVRELRDTTQFIVITHNRKTMEMADHLYGITMEEPGISKLVSVNFTEDHEESLESVATQAN